ncbi:hypothetical protein [Candidatus Halobonum tyrrellensis]|uniref:hypothetical protein n=1 Tax=Candidatus Halobonum tyrrellensis TaxID=1431545 RepID=UPI001268B00D|nr:hypothetical protein [Candidatus Halobonum tyrrellensis]
MDTDESTKATQADAGGSTETIQIAGESVETTGAGDSSDGRERAYLKERNSVLSAKLEQREATIDELQERVETLESELAALRSPSESDEAGGKQSTQQAGSDESESEESVWSRLKGIVGNNT